MMTWPIAILPNCNDCPWLFKRAIHCPSEDQCNRLFYVLFVLLLSFVYLIVLFFLWMYVVGVLFCFCMHIHVLVIIL